jgi:hypothetical protein
VGPRAGLDTKARGKILSPLPGIETRSPWRPPRNQTTYTFTIVKYFPRSHEISFGFEANNLPHKLLRASNPAYTISSRILTLTVIYTNTHTLRAVIQ